MKSLFPLLIFVLLARIACSQPFVFMDTPFAGVMQSSIKWVDVDMDGDPDLFVAGQIYSGNELLPKSALYRNMSSNKWEVINSGIQPLTFPVQDWADMDNDGDPDLIICGKNAQGNAVCKIYRNNGNGKFSELENNLPALTGCSLQWGDFDGDGRQDILLCGKTAADIYISKIFLNKGSRFEDIDADLLPVYNGSARRADFDSDGDQDILLIGTTHNEMYSAKIFMNNEGTFIESGSKIQGLKYASAVCADLNGDRLIDFIVAGENSKGELSTIAYRNNGAGSFSATGAKLSGVRTGNIDVGDFDGDGDLDLVLCGESEQGAACYIYKNNGNFNFTEINEELPGVSLGEVRWGDYDGDNDLDLLVSGLNNCYDFVTKLYRNDAYQKQSPKSNGKKTEASTAGRNMWTTREIRLADNNYYYFVYASCYCDPFTEGDKKTHVFISNVHYAPEKYSLIENFNSIIRENSMEWASIDKGNRVSTGYLTREEALEARQRILKEYQKEGFTVHFVEW